MADITKVLPSKRFGIKEVADVHFYTVSDTVDSLASAITYYSTQDPVISFDTLKVSNIESTAENSEARGGKGNAALISWDYGREITVNLEDALLSMETLSLLFENNLTSVDNTITINANTFPGTYAVIGTTYARNEATGADEVFKFIIPKAKIQSETTLTMEADGDPTVIGMTLKVLRAKNGDMMGLIHDGYSSSSSTTKYYLTFKFVNGDVMTKVITGTTTAWSSVTKPTPTSGYSWDNYPTTGNVNKNATFVEKATAQA